MTDRMIEVSGVTKRYGDFLAVDDISFSVDRGEIFGFLGPNGAGKTTTLLMLLGILRPDTGSIRIGGEKVGPGHRETRRLVGAVSENSYLYRDMTLEEYLRFFGRIHRVARLEDRIDVVLEELELSDRRKDRAGALSKGLGQKLSLARALLHDPPVLIMDEPVSGLDPHGLREVREIIQRERGRGRSIVLSSHVLSEVERTADRVGIIRRGKLLVEATPRQLVEEMAGGVRLEVELDRPAEPLASVVSAVPGVNRVETSGNHLVVLVEAARRQEARRAVSRTLTEAGATLLGLREAKATLEEVFVSVTDRKSPDEGTEA